MARNLLNSIVVIFASAGLLLVDAATTMFVDKVFPIHQKSSSINELSVSDHAQLVLSVGKTVRSTKTDNIVSLRKEAVTSLNAATDDASYTVGYIMVNWFPDSSNCGGSANLKTWQQYGTCIKSTSNNGGSGNTNSFKIIFDSEDGDAYQFTERQYSDGACTKQTSSTPISYIVGECVLDGMAVFTGVAATFQEEANGISTIMYNTNSDCTNKNSADIISAAWQALDVCYPFTNGTSAKFDSCETVSFYDTEGCNGSPTFSGNFSSDCAYKSDDAFTDDAYDPIKFQTLNCSYADNSAALVTASYSTAATATLIFLSAWLVFSSK